MSEQDLGIYAEMIDARMDDSEWAEVMAYYSGDRGQIEQQFMPTPLELISTWNDMVTSRRRREQEIRENHQRYLERQKRLLAIGDDLLHEGESPK